MGENVTMKGVPWCHQWCLTAMPRKVAEPRGQSQHCPPGATSCGPSVPRPDHAAMLWDVPSVPAVENSKPPAESKINTSDQFPWTSINLWSQKSHTDLLPVRKWPIKMWFLITVSLLLHDTRIVLCYSHTATNGLGLSTAPCRSPDTRKRNVSIAHIAADLLQRATSLGMGLTLHCNLALTLHPYSLLSLFCCVNTVLTQSQEHPQPAAAWLREGLSVKDQVHIKGKAEWDAGPLGECNCWSPHMCLHPLPCLHPCGEALSRAQSLRRGLQGPSKGFAFSCWPHFWACIHCLHWAWGSWAPASAAGTTPQVLPGAVCTQLGHFQDSHCLPKREQSLSSGRAFERASSWFGLAVPDGEFGWAAMAISSGTGTSV